MPADSRRRLVVVPGYQYGVALAVCAAVVLAVNSLLALVALAPTTLAVLPRSPTFVTLLAVAELAAIAWLWRRLLVHTHRVAGPWCALEREFGALGEGELDRRLQLRAGDYFTVQAAAINRGLDGLEARIRTVKELAARLKEEPSATNIERLCEALDRLHTSEAPVSTADSSDQTTQRGFTLLELLAVVAIVSILVLVSLPLYLDYSTRTRVSEGLALAGDFKARVVESYYGAGELPESNEAAGLAAPEDYRTGSVEAISLGAGGVITIVYDLPLLGGNNLLILEPVFGEAGVGWICRGAASGGVAFRYLPGECR
ncbi:MAG: hypothetical protein KatS3mg124_1360 [Porticoccaceae bacterium]|nr:MAG: hypothetical protein KatS3mg124_1360 [Porticoccaceae bacterium]